MDAIIYIRWSTLEQTKGDSYQPLHIAFLVPLARASIAVADHVM